MGDIHVDDLVKQFEGGDGMITAVDDVDLEIEEGEFVVLVGPSGCGKTTTLRCIAGLEYVTEGEIWIGGEDVTEKKPKNRDIAMVFQNYALYPHMTARENMAFGLKLNTDLDQVKIRERVTEASEMMGIGELMEKKPSELSGGQQQRVALGRAIVRDPEAFLMDEPLSNLDAKLRNQMRTELQDLQSELDVTTIYVTHDQVEAMTMADRIVILNDGKVQQVGTPLECYHNPVNKFVAGFIGSPSMNFLTVNVEQRQDSFHLIHQEFESTLPSDSMDDECPSEVIFGIRPEDITLASDDDADLHVNAEVVEPLGDETYLYFDIGDTRFTANVAGEEIVEEGQTIGIRFPEDRIYVFGAETSEALQTREVRASDDREKLFR